MKIKVDSICTLALVSADVRDGPVRAEKVCWKEDINQRVSISVVEDLFF